MSITYLSSIQYDYCGIYPILFYSQPEQAKEILQNMRYCKFIIVYKWQCLWHTHIHLILCTNHFRTASLEPTDISYRAMLTAYAENGDLDGLNKVSYYNAFS